MTTTVGSGLGSSFGVGAEITYGTYATPTRWVGFQSETLEWKPSRTSGKGLYAGQLTPSQDQRTTTSAAVTGNVVTDFFVKNMGLLLGNAMGTQNVVPTTLGNGAFSTVHPWSNATGQSLSAQIAIPDVNGNVHTKNLVGLACTDFQLDVKLDAPLLATFTFDGKDELAADYTTATPFGPPYTTPIFNAPNPSFFWNQTGFSIGAFGSEAAVEGVRSFNLSTKRPMNTTRYYVDGTGRKAEPVQNAESVITGTIEIDLLNYTDFVDSFYSDQSQSVILTATGGLIGGAFSYSLTVAMPAIHFDSEPPKVSGPELIMPKMTFTATYDDTHAPLTITTISSDSVL